MPLPGVNTTLVDGFSALEASREAYSDRVVIIAKTAAIDETACHMYEAQKYTNLKQVEDVHGVTSELYEAFFHALFSGCVDIYLVPIPAELADGGDRSDELALAYEGLHSVRPSILIPYGRGAQVSISTTGVVTRTQYRAVDGAEDVPDGAYADIGTYLTDLAAVCEDLSETERTCIGILGVDAFAEITASGIKDEFVTTPVAPATSLVSRMSAMTQDVTTKYVNVIVGEFETANMGPWAYKTGHETEYYRSNGALNYAGLVSRLLPHDATTGKALPASSIAFRLSRTQQSDLIDHFMVPVDAVNGVATIIKGMTFAADGSDYSRLSTVRICAAVDDAVRRVGRTFIGKGMNLEMQNSFITAVSTALGNLMKVGVLVDAGFQVIFDGLTYTARVPMTITPALELDNIELEVRIAFDGIQRA